MVSEPFADRFRAVAASQVIELGRFSSMKSTRTPRATQSKSSLVDIRLLILLAVACLLGLLSVAL